MSGDRTSDTPRSAAWAVAELAGEAEGALADARDRLERAAAAGLERVQEAAAARADAQAVAPGVERSAEHTARRGEDEARALQRLVDPLFTQAESALTALAARLLHVAADAATTGDESG